MSGAGDGIRTRDILLGKPVLAMRTGAINYRPEREIDLWGGMSCRPVTSDYDLRVSNL